MLKKIIIGLSLVFLLLLLFTLSEAVYTYRHPTQVTLYGVTLAKFEADRGQVSKSMNTLTNTAKIYHSLNKKDKTDPDTDTFQSKDLVYSHEFSAAFQKYMENLPYTGLLQTGKYDFPRVLYDIGIIAYMNNGPEITKKLWNIARIIDPTLSYWSVELANLYLFEGDKDKAKQILENCIKLPAPEKHCRDFLETIENADMPMEPGFLLTESEKFYGYKSIVLTTFPEKFNE